MSTTRTGSAKILTVIVIVMVACAAFYLGSKTTMIEQFTGIPAGEEALDTGSAEENENVARRIVERVRKLIVIQDDIEPTVATIIDVETLQERNPFYAKAENGDYLIVTPDRAILYSKERDVIIDVVPVQMQQADATQ